MCRPIRPIQIAFAAVATIVLIAGLASADPVSGSPQAVESPASPAESGTEICGHVGAMQRAREALQANDREKALRHLMEARRLLVLCEATIETEEPSGPAISI